MTDLTDSMRKDRLLEILVSYAFTPKEYAAIDKMVNNGADVKDYVLALSDGLRYGNWPWTINSIPKSQTCEYCGNEDWTCCKCNDKGKKVVNR